MLADTNYETPISISNSFGVPSQSPDVWQPDMRAAIEAAGPGQVLVPSFQGSRVEGMSEEEYIADHATTARLVKETGAKLMVMNTSCPNEGHNRLLCHNPLLVGRITEAVKQEIGDIPLHAQVKLLRVLEEKRITRLGDVSGREVDFRLITATNRDLQDLSLIHI